MPELLKKMRFNYNVIKRVAVITPRKNKEIKKLYINYATNTTATNEVVIKYRFRNALWYIIDDRITLGNSISLPANTKDEVNLTVQGLFRKRTYTLMLRRDHIYISKVSEQ